ncbi:pyridoxamine 5'-phosphate oxidase family protein [Curvibacter sp. CHRR-16]|uniref:HugZ family pyridoxamine 5'-phosphate oxidase n=1 Tax=Curvibacter sp. CHRR-16 TaxID=2835872 RepID=UPI001BD9C521|nr:pyridoxamine 5'-phosphate oxidase family protein [Curvibacter sp. CHRR-16]MBT0568865.1 pyridoxamine 5'-phosphate oxidase family protein [Curvibacter sp. CHRR-16]
MSNNPDLASVLQAAHAFPQQFQCVLLATVDAHGQPEASYAPYTRVGDAYAIYVSELSAHTSNLLHNPRCSVLFIENEADARNIFARQRLTLQCVAHDHARDSDTFAAAMAEFRRLHGPFMDVLAGLKDFHLFTLVPQQGGFVSGFARAYTLSGAGLGQIAHRNDKGHQASDAPTQQRMDVLAN